MAVDAVKQAIQYAQRPDRRWLQSGHAPACDPAWAIARGFMVSLRLLTSWHDDVVAYIEAGGLSPTCAMVELVRRKSEHAVGYHGRLNLGGIALDDFMARDAEGFVEALARSRWVIPGRPADSPLLARLVAFGGPMFRIFSEQELDLIRAWIASLPSQPKTLTQSQAGRSSSCLASDLPARNAGSGQGAAKNTDARELYHRLLNAEQHEQVHADALAFAMRWLGRAASKLHREPDAIPFDDYSHLRFRKWFEERSAAQAHSYAGPQAPVTKSREEVIAEAVQLCPMIFIDGAWLQGWTNAGLAETRIGALLYKIFSDEIGNGDLAQNHPNIYRELMRQMGVALPDFREPQFAKDPRFDDAAFHVPAFWLSLSQFPRRFLPETLGLNLAMELSGVGGAYRTARDELRHHGFSTLFVDLHNTIDNVSTGHSAMAAEAVELLMDEALASHDTRTVADHWKRIWIGFRSLSPPRATWIERFKSPRYRC